MHHFYLIKLLLKALYQVKTKTNSDIKVNQEKAMKKSKTKLKTQKDLTVINPQIK